MHKPIWSYSAVFYLICKYRAEWTRGPGQSRDREAP